MFKWAAKRFVDAAQQECLRRMKAGEMDEWIVGMIVELDKRMPGIRRQRDERLERHMNATRDA